MTQIAFNGVGIDLGGITIFDDVTFTVARGDRWGILGRNGTGKTTLFNLAAGRLEPSRGSIARASGLRLTLLDQHREFGDDTTLWDAAATPFAALRALERSLAEQAHALADGDEAALERYGRDLERFEREGGYTYAARVDAILDGLGFDHQAARHRRVGELSGGERGRLALAQQLAAPADILLLDEPTNHLDLDTTRWLERYLRELDGTVLVVSHDRAFLDAVADHVLHLENGTAVPYTGGYRAFVEQRSQRRLAQQRAYENQQKVIAAEEEYIRRNIAGQNSRQAKGRRTRLARLPRLSPPPGEGGAMALRLEPDSRGGDQVLVAEDVRLEVGGRVLVENFTARVTRGEVIGLIGPNGAGKSTLVRAIIGERALDGGNLKVGESIDVAYYRQDLSQVPPDRTIFSIIHDLRPLWNRGQVQAHLGRFDFSGDSVQRTAGSLSGGERARVALAILMLSRANFLILDEPTNHLDVESIEALEDALRDYDGTLLLVSHDRALLEELVDRIWYLEDGRIQDYPGTFADWQAQRDAALAAAAALQQERAQKQRDEERKTVRQRAASQRRSGADLRSLRAEVEETERVVHELEARLAELRTKLADPSLYTSEAGVIESRRLDAERIEVEKQLEHAFARWAEAGDALAEAEAANAAAR
ncbi:MAG: ABC-F family ATP-binding cassette domain-containing protein [Candidatus Cloacimonetes bacterium]|jgi:ATP-binding cassette subfamily F protein 3|nr:ABC-F family ATP-binding cassette domain-containing protein [Candidatus Cloacimonadota bacterium]